ncbi:MAG TPA: DUF5069 domain-containing protein [Limnochordia bacterium]|nr:DUF5069 domain-containing protein [Limnochordia bacterium]
MSWVPRSPREQLAGYYHLPRLIDKARAHLAGTLPADYQNNFTKGFDQRFLDFTGIAAEAFIQAVAEHKTDEAIAGWVTQHAKTHTPEELQAWNEDFRRLVPRDPERIVRMREAAGAADRTDVTTYFDLIDLDEGRPVPRREG